MLAPSDHFAEVCLVLALSFPPQIHLSRTSDLYRAEHRQIRIDSRDGFLHGRVSGRCGRMFVLGSSGHASDRLLRHESLHTKHILRRAIGNCSSHRSEWIVARTLPAIVIRVHLQYKINIDERQTSASDTCSVQRSTRSTRLRSEWYALDIFDRSILLAESQCNIVEAETATAYASGQKHNDLSH